MLSEHGQMLMVWWSLVLMAIFGIAGLTLIEMFPPPSPSRSAEQVAAFYRENDTQVLIGAAVCTASGGFMVPLVAAVTGQIVRVHRGGFPVWGVLHAIGGTLMTIFLAMPPLVFGTAAFTPERDPQITHAINDFGYLMLYTTVQYFLFLILAITWTCLNTEDDETNPFPRWFGYLSLWIFMVTEVGAVAFLTKTGPFAWDGLFIFWLPATTFFGWAATLGILVLRALKRQVAVAAPPRT